MRGAALPMGFNRGPLYGNGLMLAGDAAGMISPFNGEGIAYGLQAGRVAADAIAQGLARGTAAGRERAFATYERRMKDDLGGYYTLGRLFVRLIEHPEIMRILHAVRAAATAAHEVRPQAPVRLLRAARRRRGGPDHRGPRQDRTSSMTPDSTTTTKWSDAR